jgi:Mce-associated membrane protein
VRRQARVTPRPAAAARRAWTIVAAVAALVVALAAGALAAVGATKLSHGDALDEARTQALSAARKVAVDFSAYNYQQLDQDFARVAAESTGAFRDDYLKQSAGVKDLIVQVKAVSTAEVAGAAVVESSARSATVVLALNRLVTNTKVPKGQRDSFGLELTLVKKGSHWLASQVKPL